ncbi:FAD-binding oxidoreductase [Thiorhodospira sibirica]|uniref:FAD-binding oxidoreductase n=1 Tax=Thiorhodospira sibirica TaxID=154347 RepID=UPI00022C467D|nr:FAD-linked oxidase C-terminal domain-containing protein [Thiorhodospira sibirica]
MDKAVFLRQLHDALGREQVLSDPSDCCVYGYDNSRQQAPADAVVFATDIAQLQTLVGLCRQHRMPLIPRGRGTGTTGATVPVGGGVVVSFERYDQVLTFAPDDRLLEVQVGITNQTVQDVAATQGFFWPPDPTSAAYCSVGGNLAYNSAGPRAVKYGTTRDNTLGLVVVTGTGEILRTGVKTSKGVVGYDLTRLFIGSEGTLGLLVEASLKLTPLPQSKRTLQAIYTSIEGAARAVSRIMAQPVIPHALEFMDRRAIAMIRGYADIDLPQQADALLMIEVDGSNASIDADSKAILAAADGDDCLTITLAGTPAEVEALWATRKALSPALRTIAPKKINEDVVVPVSRIPSLIKGLEELSTRYGIPIVNFGHAGNGNIHVNLLINPDDPREMQAAHACLDEVFALVLSLQGTLSGEHGIGLVKREFVGRELDDTALGVMHRIKQQFDPDGILNPGKTLPD